MENTHTQKKNLGDVYFLQKKISLCNISSSVPKTYYKMQKMSKMTIFIHFFANFRVLKVDYGKCRKTVEFPADALSFIHFPQTNTLESNISSSVHKI